MPDRRPNDPRPAQIVAAAVAGTIGFAVITATLAAGAAWDWLTHRPPVTTWRAAAFARRRRG